MSLAKVTPNLSVKGTVLRKAQAAPYVEREAAHKPRFRMHGAFPIQYACIPDPKGPGYCAQPRTH
jgi:hypothetical protein